MEKIAVGKIVNTRGIKGELILLSYTSPIDNILKYKSFYTKDEKGFKELDVKEIQYYKGDRFVLKIKNINTMNEAIGMKGKIVYIDFSEIKDTLKENQFFYFQVIGAKIYIGEKYIGKAVSVHNFGSCDIIEVIYKENNKKRTVMLPIIDDYLDVFDLENKIITYKDIDGLI